MAAGTWFISGLVCAPGALIFWFLSDRPSRIELPPWSPFSRTSRRRFFRGAAVLFAVVAIAQLVFGAALLVVG